MSEPVATCRQKLGVAGGWYNTSRVMRTAMSAASAITKATRGTMRLDAARVTVRPQRPTREMKIRSMVSGKVQGGVAVRWQRATTAPTGGEGGQRRGAVGRQQCRRAR